MTDEVEKPQKIRRRTIFRHPLSAVGGALLFSGAFLFLILLLIDLSSGTENPYRSLVTFVVAPFIMLIGLLFFGGALALQIRKARKAGERIRFRLSIDPTIPQNWRNLWLFLGLSSVSIFVVAYIGTKAYEATDSTGFCGETCHVVMEPQSVTYHNSPHAKVPCVECHIGEGASFWVKAKFDGMRQMYSTALDLFDRPIQTPVHDLRPAQETCENCHWPQQFYGDKLSTRTYYRTDEENSPWTIKLLLKIGGGNPRTGRAEGIHWHMIGENRVDYIATDYTRQEIPWVRFITAENDTVVYTDPGFELTDLQIPEGEDSSLYEIRRFDCMDCHNRPSHRFQPPAVSINLALSTRRIDPGLPYVRQVGLDLLNGDYKDNDEAHMKITSGLVDYYQENYPKVADSAVDAIKQASKTLTSIYDQNFFPEMRTDYRVRENNLSHFVNEGCFRCHDGEKTNQYGQILATDCKTCHLMVAQGASEDPGELETDITGLLFEHPEDIDGAWAEMLCTECHDESSGY
ncbi:MAG: NapC/NirT family cytochrome c [candidate division Zixibacteria bacterium]|nr:NapC/NirT family cytochrome c [candidate division Zixibacteria bacterium]MDH3938428.1 NapC/NirT family cytochrome c [candidate division Zixibacteria bacterium]MDH4034601.1 NapC/NirT family cytochrome c [candidate division Zixibacteria bacterium]